MQKRHRRVIYVRSRGRVPYDFATFLIFNILLVSLRGATADGADGDGRHYYCNIVFTCPSRVRVLFATVDGRSVSRWPTTMPVDVRRRLFLLMTPPRVIMRAQTTRRQNDIITRSPRGFYIVIAYMRAYDVSPCRQWRN